MPTLICLASLLCLLGCTQNHVPQTTQAPSVFFTSAGVRFNVEIADTHALREKGLMHRQTLNPDQGMLFVFPHNDDHTFWMHNTPLSLDMVFIDDTHHVVGFIERAAPMTDTPRSVSTPSRYVLEVAAGSVQRYHIAKGDTAVFAHIPMRPK